MNLKQRLRVLFWRHCVIEVLKPAGEIPVAELKAEADEAAEEIVPKVEEMEVAAELTVPAVADGDSGASKQQVALEEIEETTATKEAVASHQGGRGIHSPKSISWESMDRWIEIRGRRTEIRGRDS